MKCEPRIITRDVVDSELSDVGISQRGPWTDSILPFADWSLLSHSQYFIGTQASTFSMLMAYYVAVRSTLRGVDDQEHLFLIVPGHGWTQTYIKFNFLLFFKLVFYFLFCSLGYKMMNGINVNNSNLCHGKAYYYNYTSLECAEKNGHN